MNDLIERGRDLFNELPVVHRVVVLFVGVLFLAGSFVFVRWVSQPTYTLLYSDLEDRDVAVVIENLEAQGVDYKLEGGGDILVPRSDLFGARARLASEGVAGGVSPEGYEILDSQGLTTNDFKQRVDFQRAVEGELARTLMALDGVREANVHLVIPEDDLFVAADQGAEASVVVDTIRPLNAGEVESIVFIVSSAVEDLAPDGVTVADTSGVILSAPDSIGGAATASNRNLQMTKQFEMQMEESIQKLLDTAYEEPGRATITVTAELDFDERETESETYEPESQVAIREQTVAEAYAGSGAPPGGAVGVDGGAIDTEDLDSTEYSRDENTREFGVDRTVARTVAAPGQVEKLSIAVVMDDGTLSGVTAPDPEEIERVVTAAAGLEADRGDTIAVTTVAMAASVEPPAYTVSSLLDLVAQAIGGLALLIILFVLFRMLLKNDEETSWLPYAVAQGPKSNAELAILAAQEDQEEQLRVSPDDLRAIAERDPEQVAGVVRSWLSGTGGAAIEAGDGEDG